MFRRQWATLAACMLLPRVGCGGESQHRGDNPSTTGGSDSTGGTTSEGGMPGDPDAGDAGEGQSGEGGRAGSGAGGASGTGAVGGMSGSGGSAVAGGGMGGGMVDVPAGWTCLPSVYRDGTSCECGCGAPDPDCDDETLGSCDVCRALGSCSATECPGTIAPDDNSKCDLPPTWACASFHYGDGVCDCGCLAADVDCPDLLPASCDNCPQSGCTPLDCEGLVRNDNRTCPVPPGLWSCAEELFDDGVCHCGCGFLDSDCDASDAAACDVCDAEGSCSNSSCHGVIAATSNWFCLTPRPPPGWTCGGYYGDNHTCDCGCGVQDVDCGDSRNVADCDTCRGCGEFECTGTVDPADITQCLPPPDDWICNAEDYGNLFCDCGCGAPDPDCGGFRDVEACRGCPMEGCTGGDCARVAPLDNTVCR